MSQIQAICTEIVNKGQFRRIGADVKIALNEIVEALKANRESALIEPARKLVNCGGFYEVSPKTMSLIVELQNAVKPTADPRQQPIGA